MIFPTDPALGPFARDPSSPVIARGDAGALDALGATAPTVYSDGAGRHAIYLGLDADGGTHLLEADEVDAGVWQKQAAPVLHTTGPVGRPAALVYQAQLLLYYDSLDPNGQPLIQTTLAGGATLAGAAQPCALTVGGQVDLFAVSARDAAIHLYVSPDAHQPFVDQGVALAASAEDGGFDAYAVSAPSVQVETSSLGRTLFRLWYTGTDQPGGTVSIGLAGSFNGLQFERFAENPVRFDGDMPSVYQLSADGGFAMLYSETAFGTPTDISLAEGP